MPRRPGTGFRSSHENNNIKKVFKDDSRVTFLFLLTFLSSEFLIDLSGDRICVHYVLGTPSCVDTT